MNADFKHIGISADFSLQSDDRVSFLQGLSHAQRMYGVKRKMKTLLKVAIPK